MDFSRKDADQSMEYRGKIQEALEALQKGRLVLVIDDKDRENEGRLICSAQAANRKC